MLLEAKTCNNWVVEKPPFREAPVGTTPKPMHRPVLEACLSLSLEGFGRRAPSLSPVLDVSGGQKSLGERVALSIDVRMKSEFGSSSQIFEMWYGATYECQVFPWCICLANFVAVPCAPRNSPTGNRPNGVSPPALTSPDDSFGSVRPINGVKCLRIFSFIRAGPSRPLELEFLLEFLLEFFKYGSRHAPATKNSSCRSSWSALLTETFHFSLNCELEFFSHSISPTNVTIYCDLACMQDCDKDRDTMWHGGWICQKFK